MNACLTILCLLLPLLHYGQQVADTFYQPELHHIAYADGSGPTIWIDEGHQNFHTGKGRYAPFARLLERDGYMVKGFDGSFDRKSLQSVDLLVISNALHASNVSAWHVPVNSAFTESEIITLERWVKQGGSLFLIADHMPLAGAAKALANEFGFAFTDGFVIDTTKQGPIIFNRVDESLHNSIITNGYHASDSVHMIASFTGQAFTIPDEATPILTLGRNHINLLPDTAWVFHPDTPWTPASGYAQGAFMNYGDGRIVVFGEAAMFSAQVAGPNRIKAGMNTPEGSENHQLLLNIIHWLDHRLP